MVLMHTYVFNILLKKELYITFHSNLFYALSVIYVVLVYFALSGGQQRLSKTRNQIEKGKRLFQQEWSELDQNPHAAAHVGTYLFRPINPLQILDPGLSDYTGVSYRIEAHRQHEPNYAVIAESGARLFFGELSLAYIFQLILPLFLLLLAYRSVSSEREQATLLLLLVQAPRPFRILLAKSSAYFILSVIWLMLAFVATAVLLFFDPAAVPWPHFLYMFLAYTGFLGLNALCFVLISACCQSSLQSLLLCLGVWIFATIILPRAAASDATNRVILPSRYVFNKKVEDGFYQGIDKDGDAATRRRQLLQQLLQQYQVDTVTKLPVNFEGLSMQAAEAYNSKVYHRYADSLEQQLHWQQSILDGYGLTIPAMAVRALSMDLSESNLFHYLHFLHRAQDYRDDFMKRLNMDMALHADNHNPYAYKPPQSFYKQLPRFRLEKPAVSTSTSKSFAYAFTGWLLLLLGSLFAVSKNMKIK